MTFFEVVKFFENKKREAMKSYQHLQQQKCEKKERPYGVITDEEEFLIVKPEDIKIYVETIHELSSLFNDYLLEMKIITHKITDKYDLY